MINVRRKASRFHKLAAVLSLVMFLLSIVPCMRLGRAQTSAVSSWLYSPVTLDGAITSPKEWAESLVCSLSLDRRWGWPDEQVEPSDKSLNAWFKNDEVWLYVLYQIPWPVAEIDIARDGGFIMHFPGTGVSESGWVMFERTFDGYGFNRTQWFSDAEAGGQNNVEGAGSYDNVSYWFEFRKMLDSGDGLDWSLTPGEFVDHLMVGIYDASNESLYSQHISLQLSRSIDPVGINVRIYPSGSVQYVSFSDYFYVKHGFALYNWSGLPADVRNAFLDPQQTNFTLYTSAPDFQNPSLTHFTDYINETDEMYTMFFFQFHPGDLVRGTYSFTGTWSAVALANPPDYTAIHFQNTITLVIVTPVPVGVNITVDPTSDLNLTFSKVTAKGYAWTNKTSTVEAPDLVNLVGQYYDITVTANYSDKVTVSLAYGDSNMTQQQESDLQMMQYTPILGDIVSYGQVNILDISFVAKCFGTTSASSNWNATADINGDEKINIVDISTCAKNFGKTAKWTNITTYIDTELNIIHGETAHFSIIGIH